MIPWRALAVGLALIPVNAWFVVTGLYSGQSRPTTVSLILNVVVTLGLVVGVNALVARFRPRWALSRAELAVLYGMLSVGSAVCGLDQVQTAAEVVAHPFWGATPENKWEDLFLRQVPRWLTVSDPAALEAYFDSRTPMFRTTRWRPWVSVAAVWSGFSLALCSLFLCLNALLRRQWTDEAKLSFPIVQFPLEMTHPRGLLWRSAPFWIGFAAAFGIDALNGLHFLYPKIPHILGEMSSAYDLNTYVRNQPWRAMGWTPMRVFPFGVGLAFFIPLDLAFSSWFFYVITKFERIAAAALGWGNLPRAPWIDEQMHAAYLALAVSCLWSSRRHLRRAVQAAFGRPLGDDAQEPLPYSAAFWAAAALFAGLVAFLTRAGMGLWVAVVFLLMYLALSVAVTRIRAELGSPVHDLHKIGPEAVITEVLGPGALGVRNLVAFAFMWSINRAHRSHPMPHQLEAMKLCEVTGGNQRGLSVCLTAAAALGLIVGWLVMLNDGFAYGGRSWKGQEAFVRLQTWLTSPAQPDWRAVGGLIAGGAVTVALAALRSRFVWWPLHPVGFAVSGGWSMALFAPSILTAWLIKSLLLRYGGMSSIRPASRLFMGLVLGEFLAGTLWALYGIARHQPMYNFLP